MTINREQLLDNLRAFAKRQAEAAESADHDSLARAAEIAALYEDRSWVGELDPPKRRASRGRPVDPESFSRFTKWLAERVPLASRRAYQLKAGHDLVANYLNSVQLIPTGEGIVRPLRWLERNDYADRIPEVWELACKLAGNAPPDEPTVRRAVFQWRDEHLPKSERKTREKGAGRRKRLAKWRDEALALLHEDPAEFARALKTVEQAVEGEMGAVLGR